MAEAGVPEVAAFWNTAACGTHFIGECAGDAEFFTRYREFRYRTEWHIPAFARFERARGRRVLEIGCGNGADGVMFAAHGAQYTGCDLTDEALDATRRHLSIEGLEGKLQPENAERLSFADASFDIVYSYGVLHHSPAPASALREVHRVLRPGGVALIMLYHRHSFNYYARILGYMRARVLLTIAARAGRLGADRREAPALALSGVRGNASARVWEIHYRNFLRQGWAYLAPGNFVHHCTDGPECPIAYVYSRREAAALFAGFSQCEMSVAHFPLNKYPVAKLLPRGIERWLADRMGWHLLIRATK
jgi:SAM-dependent methyltransferase